MARVRDLGYQDDAQVARAENARRGVGVHRVEGVEHEGPPQHQQHRQHEHAEADHLRDVAVADAQHVAEEDVEEVDLRGDHAHQ